MHTKLISIIVLTPLLAGLLQAQVIPTTTTAVESYDMPGYFLACTTTTGAVRLVQGADQTPQGQWNIVTGLIGTGTVSFMPVALPNHYMRHMSFILYAYPAATDTLFMGDASFTPRLGLANPTCVSFESQNYPGRFLQHNTSNPMGLVLQAVTAGNEGAATFKFPATHPELATKPIPEDEATDVFRATSLNWTPGVYAATHDVYLGTSLSDVNTATRANPLGVLISKDQAGTTCNLPQRLEFSTTYYWRIDEVNAPPTSTIYKGNVWSFTTEPYVYKVTNITATASSQKSASEGPENTINGSGLTGDLHGSDYTTMWLSLSTKSGGVMPAWIRYDFDRVYKLYEMWVWNHNSSFESIVGLGAMDTTVEYSVDGTTWTKLGNFQFAQASGDENYAHDITVPFNGAAAKSVRITISSSWATTLQAGLSEVRFFCIPVAAREPSPATGSTAIDPTTLALGWRPGREAASHNVYMGTDANALTLAGSPAVRSFTPANISLGTKYYWRVDEVNTAETPATWASEVWNFATPDFLVVDDMESYNDTTSPIYGAWTDGYGTTTNGAQVGNDNPPFAETSIVHGGTKSMPFIYGKNSLTTSEATRTFTTAQDWTKYGITTLTLFFNGKAANTTGQLYVKINGTKVTYSDASAMTRLWWTQWNIPLASVGANLKAVTSLCVGVSGSASGTLYVDDIRLYRSAPAMATEQLWIEAESATPTVPAPWVVTDDPLASGGKYITTPSTATASTTNPPTTGVATYNFTVKGGVYRLWFRTGPILGGANDSFWVRIKDATISPTGNAANPGWIRANNLSTQAGMATWHWVQVWDDEHGSVQVTFTLPAGSHTLEVGYRELATPLDAILITNN
jgi:hypothetical protein